jgi:hypothetical protein
VVLADPPVTHAHDPVACRSLVHVVRHHREGLASLLVVALQHGQHRFGALGIIGVAGRTLMPPQEAIDGSQVDGEDA